MFPYLRTRKDFLDDCENTDIIVKMKDEIARAMRKRKKWGKQVEVNKADYESWKETMKLFQPIMQAVENDVSIAFEYMMDYPVDGTGNSDGRGFHRRVDVMVGGHKKYTGKRVIIIAEMKQWDTIYKNNQKEYIYYYKPEREKTILLNR